MKAVKTNKSIKGLKKSPWITDYDAGGCISGDTELILGNGEIVSAEELINRRLEGGKVLPADEREVARRAYENDILSWKEYNPLISKTSKAFKLKSPGKLLNIRTRTGKLKLTPDHKVLIDSEDGPVWKKAGELKEGDYTYSCSEINVRESVPKLTMEKAKEPNEDLMYVLGLIASDGFITRVKGGKGYKICFDNNEKELIREFREKCEKIVGKKIKKYQSEKQPNLIRCYFYSKPFFDNSKKLGISKEIDLKKMFMLPKILIRQFLAGYFDGDGSIEINNRDGKQKRFVISFAVKNEETAKQLCLLLKRLGIVAVTNKAINRSGFGTKQMNAVRITTKEEILKFLEKIPFKHPKKVDRKKQIIPKIRALEEQGKILYAPLLCNTIIKHARKNNKIPLKMMHYDPSVIQKIERMGRVQKNTVAEIYDKIKKNLSSSERKTMEQILHGKYYLDEIKEIKEEDCAGFVYNFEVTETQAYLPANGFVISNCNGCNLEIYALLTPRYDMERLGIIMKGSPRNADILIVQGCVNKKAVQRVKTIYSQMAYPKVVIAVGVCAISGGPFREAPNFGKTLDEIVPVDVYVPGCPPRPEAIINGIAKALGILGEKNGEGKNGKRDN